MRHYDGSGFLFDCVSLSLHFDTSPTMNRMMNIVRSFSSYRTAAISKEATAATSEPLVMLSASDTNHTIDDRNRKNDVGFSVLGSILSSLMAGFSWREF